MHTQTVYLIFWEPNYLSNQTTSTYFNTQYSNIQTQFFNDLATDTSSTYLKILSQYYSNTNSHLSGSLSFDPNNNVVLDADTFPNSDCSDSVTSNVCIKDSDIQAEIASISNYYHYGTGLNSLYILYTPENQGSCYSGGCAFTDYCAYHNVYQDSYNNEYIYANVPYGGAGDGASACSLQNGYGGYAPGGDYEDYSPISSASHEMFEAATDPERGWDTLLTNYDAWSDPNTYSFTINGTVRNFSNQEIGDKCDYPFKDPNGNYFPLAKIDSTTGTSDSGNDSDIVINGHYYAIQAEWSNALTSSGYNTGCTLSYSPANINNTIYSAQSSYGSAYYRNIVAYNSSDGSNTWTYTCSTCDFASKPAVDYTNGWLYAVDSANNQLVQLDAKSGYATSTTFSLNSGYTYDGSAPPIFYNGLVIVSAYKSGANPLGILYAYRSDGSTAWTTLLASEIPYVSTFGGGYLYAISSDNDYLYEINAASGGTPVWTYTSPDGFIGIQNNFNEKELTYANGVLYYGSQTSGGTNYVNAVNVTGSSASQIWKRQVPGQLEFSPAVDSAGAYFTSGETASPYHDRVYGIRLDNGENLWTPLETNYANGSAVAISGGNLYVYETGLYSINESTGASNWSNQLGSYYGGLEVPVVENGKVYVSITDNEVAVYDATTNEDALMDIGSYLGDFTLPSNGYQDIVSGDGSTGFWSLADIAGGLNDLAGSNNMTSSNVTFAQAPINASEGYSNQFNGTSSYASQASNGTNSLTTNFSVEEWIKPSSLPSSGNLAGIIAKNASYGLFLDGSHLAFKTTSSSTSRECQATSSASTGSIYDVIGTYDGSHMDLYVNGQLSCSMAATGSIDTNSNPLVIGSLDTSSDFYTGNASDAAIYSGVLNQSQSSNHYFTGELTPNSSFCGTSCIEQDNFNRANQSHWGTASDGTAWSADASSNSAYSISSDTGLQSGGGTTTGTLGASETDSEVLASGSMSSYSSAELGVVARYTDSNNFYRAYLDGYNLKIKKNVGGTATVLASTAFSPSANTNYTIDFNVQGTTLEASVWPTNGNVPPRWMAVATDSSLSSGNDGTRSVTPTGVTATYTFFEIENAGTGGGAAYTNVLSHDTYSRSANQTYWGTASDGNTWGSDASSNSHFSITGCTSACIGSVSGGGSGFDGTLGASATDMDVTGTMSTGSFTSSGSIGLIARFTDSNNYYKAGLNGTQLVITKKLREHQQPLQAYLLLQVQAQTTILTLM